MQYMRAASRLTRLFRCSFFPSANSSIRCSKFSGKTDYREKCGLRDLSRTTNRLNSHILNFLIVQTAAITYGITASFVSADASESSDVRVEGDPNSAELSRVEDESVISNEHTIKWRIFTDSGRDHFLQGKLENAEKLFIAAINEAKEGFGERDAHVASAFNNLAELHRVKKEYEKAEPLYLQAIKILEETFGVEDIRVGAALHNLGIFYFLQKKCNEARQSYERALKIKGRILGYNHLDYGDTMYRLGMVLYLEGNPKDAEAFIQSSIDILEGAGEGESIACMRRLRYLAQIYARSHRVQEAENTQRRILHILELSKGWDSMGTIMAAEGLAQTLQTSGKISEARELLERCLEARKSLLPSGHLQIGSNLLQLAKTIVGTHERSNESSIVEAETNLALAKDYLEESIRIAGDVLVKYTKKKWKLQQNDESEGFVKEGRAALVVLLQALWSLSQLEIIKQKLVESEGNLSYSEEAEKQLFRCISAYKEFEKDGDVAKTGEVEREYAACLNHLSALYRSREAELHDKILQLEGKIRPSTSPVIHTVLRFFGF